VQLPGNDNTFLGYISNGLAGFAQIDNPGAVNGDGYDPLGPASIDFYQNIQQARRFIGSLQANYRPLSWLRFNGVAGIDQVNRLDTQTLPPGRIDLDAETREGYRFANRLQNGTYTAQATATAQFNPLESVASTTTASFQYQQDANDGVFGGGYRLVAGTSSLTGAVTRFSASEAFGDSRLVGGILSQQLGFRDRLFVSAGVRGDNSSAFGENFGTVFYPTAQASWVASEEGWFPRGSLDLVRFRGSFGRSGLRPGNVDALTFFNPVPARVIAPSVGVVRTRFENIGEIRNRGFEALMTLRPVDTRAVGLDLTVNYSYNTNKILTLRDTTPIIITGNGSQQHAEGYPAGGYWGQRITGVTKNAQGIVEDVELGEQEFLGYSQPRTLFSVSPQLSLFNNAVRLGGVVDYRGGYKQYNSSEDFRCGITSTCRGIIDPASSEEEQARAVATYNYGAYAGFIEKADFVRFREVTLSFSLPERLSQRFLGTRGVGVTLAGYNLGIITDYTGVDPEVNASAQANFVQSDFLSQAPVRRFSARVNVNF
jgi:hypothetical protein